MNEETEDLAAVMLQADRFCSKIEAAIVATPSREELWLKLNQARALLADLQLAYNGDKLSIQNAATRAGFLSLITTLQWVSFHARDIIDFKTFRMLVMVQWGFSSALMDGLPVDRAS